MGFHVCAADGKLSIAHQRFEALRAKRAVRWSSPCVHLDRA